MKTLATKITLLRILLVPVLLLTMQLPITPLYIWFNIIFFIGLALTDFLDGWLARARKEESDTGKFLDPLADKILIISVLIVMVEMQEIGSIAVILVVFRELFIVGFRSLASLKGIVVGADIYGKVKTVFQMITIVYIMLAEVYFLPFVDVMVWIMVLITLYSGLNYIIKNKEVLT